ncbi:MULTISPECIES: hypothetical protein [unclassified Lentimonas]|uniref:hypothetical protein n=1 Tax=unclassified Lentimonas TaxID=2630993 RepID=UPI0013270B0B|nr:MULTISPECIES: hypothetical protein [unclassified Lentimonas]CAA6677314.1 Unannotated [Lentimonas sp. CC4]CAA6686859.1 Unannotated [Lentimonas sp. CC6]CAA7074560.1 Unannotated [Lentimonas sp. CC4]CAA7169176.1 Unannotated [Lentimonas sp. CC21]CAA7180423.1 Unannotated [Lentimonas sp. CC8]
MNTLSKQLFAALLLCCVASSLSAVSVSSNAIANKALFGITFPADSKEYYGKEAAIHSISKQEYITSGFRVVEINIVTAGSGLLRIYHSRALKLGELQAAMDDGAAAAGVPSTLQRSPVPPGVQEMADRASGVVEAMTSDTVMKEYPLATHARTIEYRVQTRSELLDLFDELQKHWLKEPAFYESGQIVDEDEATSSKMEPRSLGGTRFIVE